MRRSPYPLEPFARLKEGRVEGAVRELGKAVSARQDAERRRAEAEAARRQAGERASRIWQEERASLEKGGLHVADLLRASAWEVRVKKEDAERARAVEEARATEGTKRRLEVEGRGKVAAARGEAKAVLRHEARWNEARQRERDAREEEEAAEAARPKPLR